MKLQSKPMETTLPHLENSAAVQPQTVVPTKITITIPTNAYFVSGIRDFTLELTKNMTGFSEQWAFRFQAIIDELTNNAIEHGSSPGEEVKITFLSVHGQYIEIWVEDSGTGKNPKKAAEMEAMIKERKAAHEANPLANLSIRGRGLPLIVANWCDEMHFDDLEPKGLRIRVKKTLHAEEDPGGEKVYQL